MTLYTEDGAILYYGEGLYGEGTYNDPEGQDLETSIVNKALTPLPPPVFTGLCLQEDVSLDTLVFNSIDANNVIWVCTDIEGWWGLPDPEVPDIPRGWGDGSYEANGRWAARQINLTGVFFPPGPEYVSTARNTLIRAASLARQGAWLKTNESPTRASFVRLSGRPEIQTVNSRGKTEFSIGLRASDPIKYSWNNADALGYNSVTIPCKNTSTSELGTATINNLGNTNVTMFLEIDGPVVGNATIKNTTTGQTLTIVDSIALGELFEIDTYKHEVALDGDVLGARVYLDTLTDWLELAPGNNSIVFEDLGDTTSDAILTVYYRSGWIG